MNLVILGRGKTGSLVAEVAAERRHRVRIAGAKENAACAALAADRLDDIDAVIDFTAPHGVIANIEACVTAGKNMVVGTTGWYEDLDRIRDLVNRRGTGFIYGANFSVGVNLFFDVAPLRRRRCATITPARFLSATTCTKPTPRRVRRSRSGGSCEKPAARKKTWRSHRSVKAKS